MTVFRLATMYNHYHCIGVLLLAERLFEVRTEVEDRRSQLGGRTLGPVRILRRRRQQLECEYLSIQTCLKFPIYCFTTKLTSVNLIIVCSCVFSFSDDFSNHIFDATFCNLNTHRHIANSLPATLKQHM